MTVDILQLLERYPPGQYRLERLETDCEDGDYWIAIPSRYNASPLLPVEPKPLFTADDLDLALRRVQDLH